MATNATTSGVSKMESLVDPSVQSTVVSGMSEGAAAAANSRTRRWDQLSADAAALWNIAMTSPTIYAAEAIGMVNRQRVNPTIGSGQQT